MYDREAARELLNEELAEPEYQRQFSGPVREAIDTFLQWLQEDAFDVGLINIPAGPLVALILLAAAVTVALLVIRPRLQRSGAPESQVEIEAHITAEQLRVRADRHAQARHYDDAARDRFRALVRAAEEAGLLRGTQAATASELAEQLAARFGDHAEQLRTAAGLFNLSQYGSAGLSSQHYEQLRALDAQLDAAEPTGSSAIPGAKLVVPR